MLDDVIEPFVSAGFFDCIDFSWRGEDAENGRISLGEVAKEAGSFLRQASAFEAGNNF